MLAVKPRSFIGSRIRVPIVGAEWCVYRMLDSDTLRAAVIASVYVEGMAVFIPMTLSCYRSVVTVRVTGLSLSYVCLSPVAN